MKQHGRHRYHRLASAEVVHLLESIAYFAARPKGTAQRAMRTGPRDAAVRLARTCYNPFAGQLGVSIADAMRARGQIVLDRDGGAVTEPGLPGSENFPVLRLRAKRRTVKLLRVLRGRGAIVGRRIDATAARYAFGEQLSLILRRAFRTAGSRISDFARRIFFYDESVAFSGYFQSNRRYRSRRRTDGNKQRPDKGPPQYKFAPHNPIPQFVA